MTKRKIIDVEIEVEHIINWIKNYFIKNGPNSKAIIGISGGKDSTVAAALLCRALGKDRVVGVIMPDGTMSDFTIAKDVCGYLGINSIVVDIGSITSALYRAIDDGYDDDHCIKIILRFRLIRPHALECPFFMPWRQKCMVEL